MPISSVDVGGNTIRSGQVMLGAAYLPDTVSTTMSDATAVNDKIGRRQTVNAFGETIQEIDATDRVTDFGTTRWAG